jgi:hypothetical protein
VPHPKTLFSTALRRAGYGGGMTAQPTSVPDEPYEVIHRGGEAAAIAQLAGNPYPPEAFHRSDYQRLRVGPCRVVYMIEDNLVTIERVERVA